MAIIIIECRRTKKGAYTTANAPKFGASKTGTYWQEKIEGNIGDVFIVTDISNSGKHNCFKARITGELNFEIIEKNDKADKCNICNQKSLD